MRGAGIATIHVFPLRFDPGNNKLNLVSQIQFTIVLPPASKDPFPPLRESRIRHDEFVGVIKSMVENPWDVDGNLPEVEVVDDEDLLPGSVPAECLVITGKDPVTHQSLADAFIPYRNWMTRKGVPTEIVTVDSIYQHYTGRDDAEKIRNFIIDNYADPELSRHYVILGGNVDRYDTPGINEAVVPGRLCRLETHDYLCDLYFAEVTSDWYDIDGGVYGGDFALDMGADVCVGRIPAENAQDVENWINKRLRFEINPGGQGGSPYLNKVLITYAPSWDPILYDMTGYFPDWFEDPILYWQIPWSTCEPIWPLRDDITGHLESGVQFYEMMNPGWPDMCFLRTERLDCPDLPPYDQNWQLTTGALRALSSTKNRISLSPAYWLGNLDFYPGVGWDDWGEYADGCFAQVDLCSQSGSVAARYNTRPSQYCQGTRLLDRYTLQFMLNDGQSIGWAHYSAKPHVEEDDVSSPGVKLQLKITNNLFGCPELKAWTAAPPPRIL